MNGTTRISGKNGLYIHLTQTISYNERMPVLENNEKKKSSFNGYQNLIDCHSQCNNINSLEYNRQYFKLQYSII